MIAWSLNKLKSEFFSSSHEDNFSLFKTIVTAVNLQDKEVAGIIENVYSKFKLMLIKKDDNSKNSLVSQLTKINQHLEGRGYRLEEIFSFIRTNEYCLKVPHGRHDVLFWLRADAEVAAHQSGGEKLRGFWNSLTSQRAVAIHGPDVQSRRLHGVLSCRPGHLVPLQDAAGNQDVQARGAGDSDLHQRRPLRLRC